MAIKLKPFDAAEFLGTDEAIAAFLGDALESGDSAVFQDALQTAARARGMSEVAKDAGLGRESLYKALKPDAQPRFDTVQKVIAALGVTLTLKISAPSSAAPKMARSATMPGRASGKFVVKAGKKAATKRPAKKRPQKVAVKLFKKPSKTKAAPASASHARARAAH